MLRLWTVLTLCAGLAGAVTWCALDQAYAQATAESPVLPDGTPGTVQPDGTVSLPAGVPIVQQGKEIGFIAETFQAARAAASEKRWGLFVSILLMALLAGFNALLIRSQDLRDRIRAYMGEVAMGMAMLGYCGIALASLPAGAHITDWLAILGPAIKTGLAAIGAYEFLIKRVLGFWIPKIMVKLFPPKGVVPGAPVEPPKP